MSGKTILYVEDNELNRKIVRDLLRRTSYRLIEAPDGEAGVEMALAERPGLILMDVQLPKISGFEATRRLRAEPATADTPIIAITSFALSGDEQRAKEAGASTYLAKPYSPFTLLEMIRKLLPKREPGRAVVRSVGRFVMAYIICGSGVSRGGRNGPHEHRSRRGPCQAGHAADRREDEASGGGPRPAGVGGPKDVYRRCAD